MTIRPEYIYIMALKIAQPAREQDIRKIMKELTNNLNLREIDKERVRLIHEEMRKQRIIFPVKRGTYWLTPAGERALGSRALVRKLESNRLFLMKQERRRKR